MSRSGGVPDPGAWPSPVSAQLVVSGSVGLGEVRCAEVDVVWSELRPEEGGRVQLVAHHPDGRRSDLLPDGFSARTRVHEYGGGAWWLHDDTVFFANFEDQRLWRLDPGARPEPLTPPPAQPGGDRYADGCVTPDGLWIVCVRERHDPTGDEPSGEPSNELVAIPAHGGEPRVLVGGRDFVAAPRLSPDGSSLAWLAWDHPAMPWDAAELWLASFSSDGLGAARKVAGGAGESVAQPEWSGDGRLHFVSDRSGWWNLYRLTTTDSSGTAGTAPGEVEAVALADAEMASPAWVFAQSRYVVGEDGRVLVVLSRDGVESLGVVEPTATEVRPVATPYTALSSLRPFGLGAVVIGASFEEEPVVAALDVPVGGGAATVAVLRSARDLGIDSAWWSRPEHITFPTGAGEGPVGLAPGSSPTGGSSGEEVAHGLFYPPCNPDIEGLGVPAGPPPLVVTIHGGPTAAARPQLNLEVQFWTSRGFAVVDVNYRGSVGYGRAYRDRLAGGWGVLDVEDCVAAARWLAAAGRVDGERLTIKGGSAGGFTALCVIARGVGFAAGCTRYGVTDLRALARDTHKFEARYLDGLIGPWPEAEQVYRERSPISQLDRLRAPLLVLQGSEDEIVPPSQARELVEALDRAGVPHAYLVFEGEQHGFRRAESIEAALGAELYFFATVLGLEAADDVAPIPIAHLPDDRDVI